MYDMPKWQLYLSAPHSTMISTSVKTEMPFTKVWNWLNGGLYRKYVAGSATGLLLMCMVFYLVFIGMYRGQLEEEQSKASSQMNQLLQATLENAMLKRDLDGLRGIVQRLGGQREIVNTMILNPGGEVRFASTDKQLGLLFPEIGGQKEGWTVFTRDSDDREVLRSVNPFTTRTSAWCATAPPRITRSTGFSWLTTMHPLLKSTPAIQRCC